MGSSISEQTPGFGILGIRIRSFGTIVMKSAAAVAGHTGRRCACGVPLLLQPLLVGHQDRTDGPDKRIELGPEKAASSERNPAAPRNFCILEIHMDALHSASISCL